MLKDRLQQRQISLCANFEAAARPYTDDLTLYKHTNCYSYALGLPQLGIAVPGSLASFGQIYPYMFTAEHMRKLMAEDGLIEIDHDALAQSNTQVIGLVIKEYLSGHFLKYHQDGTWSQQDGFGGQITNRDCANQIITDLREANLGYYDAFIGYFKVPDTGLHFIPRI